MDEISRQQVKDQIEKLDVHQGDVLVVKAQTGRESDLIAQNLRTLCPQAIAVLFLYPPHPEILVLNEAELNLLGYYKR